MKSATALFLAGVVCVLGMADLTAIELDDIAHQIEAAAKEGAGISQTEQKISKEIVGLGAPAIPYLLPLLKHKNKDVRALAAYTIIDIPGLKEEHLDALIESKLKGNGWIPAAIARIGTPKAIQFLVEELKKEQSWGNQVDHGLIMIGSKGVPYLVDLYRTGKNDGDLLSHSLLSRVSRIFGELGAKAQGAVDPLVVIASNEKLHEYNRQEAILALGAMGDMAHRTVPALQKLAERDSPAIAEAVEIAIVHMEAPEALGIQMKRLRLKPSFHILRDIAELRKYGRPAGPDLIQYLSHEDWEIRIGAARAMGYIGYEPASRQLIELLNSEDDWRLVFVAAESLGDLRSKEGVPTLKEVSQVHWYSPVRDVAKEALEIISSGVGDNSEISPENLDSRFSNFEQAGWELEKSATIENLKQGDKNAVRSKGSLNKDKLEEFVYEAGIHSYGPKGKMIRKRKQIPGTGIRVENGYLVGADRGEFGGELMFVDEMGKWSKILDDNIQGIYHTASGIVVVAGLAHMGFNRGTLYKVSKAVDGKWNVAKWKALPGDPYSSALLGDGSLFIGSPYGNVLVSPDGSIRMAKIK